MQELLDVVAEPRRRQILALLLDGERLVGDLAHELGVAQPTVSKHLRVMREVGLVESRVDGQRRWYRLVAEPLAELDTWLEPYRRAWVGRLDDPGLFGAVGLPPPRTFRPEPPRSVAASPVETRGSAMLGT